MLLRESAIAVLACVVCVLTAGAEAQTEVRPYPDPGYRSLGVYGGGPKSYFDYHLAKLSLGDSFPNKKGYWANLEAVRGKENGLSKHEIFVLYCGERETDLPRLIKRIDAWLKPEPEIPTFPNCIPAVCLGEENQPSRNPVLDGLARHIRDNYGIPVLQWYTNPLGPGTELTADGWIWDSYGMDERAFRKHLMKFVCLGKPAICVPWATDPHWTQWSQFADTTQMINREWIQFRTAMEFNVSTAAFAVAGAGAMNPWLGSDTPDMIDLRNCLRAKRAAMHAFKPGELPLSSANFSARDRSVPVGGDVQEPSVYEESFSGFRWIHDANLSGFLDVKLTSRPDEPGFLLARTDAGRPVQAALVYRFASYFPLQSVKVTLDAAAPRAASCLNEIALSTDELGNDWPLRVEQKGNNQIEPLLLAADEKLLQSGRVFYLRVRMTNHAGQDGLPGNRLDRLRVQCVHQPPGEGAAATLAADLYGNLYYDDDFSTTRWRHLGKVEVGHPSHGGYRSGGFWVGMVGGYPTSAHVVQRINSPREVQELNVAVDCYANAENLGGSATLQVAPRGQKPRWETSSAQKSQTPFRHGTLNVRVPPEELKGLREFDVHVRLGSTSGVEGQDRACATLQGLRIRAK